ncbi:MAG: adenosine deaminase [Chloroflexi bacterium RBG_16_57_11]|nr:MAG: adenosine deaminase [Chloroflexi bacterium RBG_16_57_11]
MLEPALKTYIERIPKTELHCHLEGSIQPATLLKLAARHGIELPFTDEEGAKAFYEFTSLNQFLGIFALACSTLKTRQDFETITLDLGADSASQGIPYREVFFTYAYHDRRSIPWEEVISGIASGREKVKQQYNVEMWFIADIDRTVDPQDGVRLVEMAQASRDQAGIIGIGLDSQEIGYPAKRQKPAFDLAKRLGLHRVAHAGEDVGPESVWDALQSLDVERIDHGVRSIDDPALVKHLAERQVALTVCPLSNIELKVYPQLRDHPVKRLTDAGVLVMLNSDDPPMFHCNVLDNYFAVAETFNLNAADIDQYARNSFKAAFLPDERKQQYLADLEREIKKLRSEIL